jgi:fatty acid desaturase
MRLSDAERQEAMETLSEHVRTGRLDIDEFGERSARVSTAKTYRDLAPLFEDLPAPRPGVLGPDRTTAAPAAVAAATPLRRLAVPLAVLVALVLFFGVARVWLVFLIPVIVVLVFGLRSDGRANR